ncbi:hypothetical protein [Nitrosovibrio sp. Nv6]|uniref:hypothetical protein n=1 Tax=Nitrosovibrio sp. Nv6 TaxID=1855340 RepID=UPI0008D019E8|nr:hypothetical protein [Nitrosovibrio sp. Nv6]SEO78976.1 hypothetical protein SAMN05216316_1107 [Nitrosovibrio sp. Nv6]
MEKVTVSADALRSVLTAFMGPQHLIAELRVIHSLHEKMPGVDGDDPVGTLISEFNNAVAEHNQTAEADNS